MCVSVIRAMLEEGQAEAPPQLAEGLHCPTCGAAVAVKGGERAGSTCCFVPLGPGVLAAEVARQVRETEHERRVGEIRADVDAAYPGDWEVRNNPEFDGVLHLIWGPEGALIARTCMAPFSEPNARLMAHAGKHLRYLLGCDAAAQEQIARQAAMIEGLAARAEAVSQRAEEITARFDAHLQARRENFNVLWSWIYPDNPRGWEYPGQVVNHVGEFLAERVKERDAERARADALAGQVATLRAALERFGAHDPDCHTEHPYHGQVCDCGYDAALAETSAGTGGKVAAVVEAATAWREADKEAERNPAALLSCRMTTDEASAVMDRYFEAQGILFAAVDALTRAGKGEG